MPLDLFNLTGKTALVTGGSKGLGKAMARGLAEAGADVVISSRHEDELRTALGDILKGLDRRGSFVVADMSRREQIAPLAKAALELNGRIDILINNAGTNKPEPIDAITDEAWDQVLEINLSSVMALTRALVPQMKARGWGRVIHISSVLGFLSKEKRNGYSATKAALLGLARASALDLGPHGVTVNCIAPGPFLTDLPMSILSDAEKKAFADHTALGRWGDPKELVGPALLLASDAGSYITGQTIVVDGGFLVREADAAAPLQLTRRTRLLQSMSHPGRTFRDSPCTKAEQPCPNPKIPSRPAVPRSCAGSRRWASTPGAAVSTAISPSKTFSVCRRTCRRTNGRACASPAASSAAARAARSTSST